MLAVEVLMQTVIVAFAVLQQKWRRPKLAGIVTPGQERLVASGVTDIDIHRLIPPDSDGLEARIESGAQFRDRLRQRIGEIFVFAAPEAVAAHHNPAAKYLVFGIERRQCAAFIWREQSLQHGATLPV